MSNTIKANIYQTLEEAEKNDTFVIINNSDGQGARPKGQIIFAVRGKDGSNTPVIIPPTWIPIDLRGYITKDDLMSSNVLRDYIRKRILVLITPDTEERLKAHEDYQKEYDRVNKIVSIVSQAATIDISVGSAAQNNGGSTPNGIIAIETPGTKAIMNAGSDGEMVNQFDKMLQGLQVGELKFISSKSATGSLVQMIAMELESDLMQGGIKIASVKETESYKLQQERGLTTAPSMQF